MTPEIKLENGQYILHGDWYEKIALQYIERYSKQENPILIKKNKPGKIGLSRRVLSHWREMKLVDSTGYLSLRDVFWIRLIMEVRKFGMPLKKIMAMKDSLLSEMWIAPYLDVYLTLKLANPLKDFYIIVYSDGTADIGSSSEIEFSEIAKTIKHGYIKISIQEILNSIYIDNESPITNKLRLDLDKEEVSALDYIRSGKYEEILVKVQNGDISRIKKKQNRNPEQAIKQIRELVKKGGYGDITLKMQDGKVVHLESNTLS
jgi:hypothetical protein